MHSTSASRDSLLLLGERGTVEIYSGESWPALRPKLLARLISVGCACANISNGQVSIKVALSCAVVVAVVILSAAAIQLRRLHAVAIRHQPASCTAREASPSGTAAMRQQFNLPRLKGGSLLQLGHCSLYSVVISVLTLMQRHRTHLPVLGCVLAAHFAVELVVGTVTTPCCYCQLSDMEPYSPHIMCTGYCSC
jgi:hypothetical protein